MTQSSQQHPTLLIVGVDSQIGAALYNKLQADNRYRVFGTSRRARPTQISEGLLHLDLSDENPRLHTHEQFNHVVFCAGMTNTAYCDAEPKVCHKINVEHTSKLIQGFSETGSHIVFLSSNAVFDGSKSFYSTHDLPSPANNYGRFKLEVENYFNSDPNVAILRLTKVITSSTPFIKRWNEALNKNTSIKVYENRLISPVRVADVVESISLLLARRSSGVFHFGGMEEISYADFAKQHFSNNPAALELLSVERDPSQQGGAIHSSLATYLPTSEDQYQDLLATPRVTMGLMSGYQYYQDPKRLAFTFSRYKFVAKMLSGRNQVLEIGCSDGFASAIVLKEVNRLTAVDFDWTFISDARIHHPYRDSIEFKQADMTVSSFDSQYDAAFCLDVLEHIQPKDEHAFLSNISDSLNADGVLIVGVPSLESQQYASDISKAGHVNCKTAPVLKKSLEKYFANVFLFSMNDEVVHTGFAPMAHYLFALCTNKKEYKPIR